MADLLLTAHVVWTVEEDGIRAVGLAESEEPEDGYLLIQAGPGAGAAEIYLEINDEIFGAEGALDRVAFAPGRLSVTLRPEMAGRFGMVRQVELRLPAATPGLQPALDLLRAILPAALVEG